MPDPWWRWLNAELLPWARQNAQAREATSDWCKTLVVGQPIR